MNIKGAFDALISIFNNGSDMDVNKALNRRYLMENKTLTIKGLIDEN